MSEAMIGYGSKFLVGNDASPPVYTEVAEVMDITPPSDSVDTVDVTHMQSPDRTREFIAGLNDPGEVSFSINFIPGGAGDTQIQAMRDRERRPLRILFPNDIAWDFEGFLTGYKPKVPVADKMTADITLKVTGSYEVETITA